MPKSKTTNSTKSLPTPTTPKTYPERVHRRIEKLAKEAVTAGLIQDFCRTETGYDISLVGELLPKSCSVIYAGVFLVNLLGKVNISPFCDSE